jgi:Family of unknown function (DUF6221)
VGAVTLNPPRPPDAAELLAFFEARLDEDEKAANGAAELSARTNGPPDPVWADGGRHGVIAACGTLATGYEHEMEPPISAHIARWDPARVLADVAAKRSLIEDYRIVVANNAIERRLPPDDEVRAAARELIAKSLLMILRRLAAAYTDHPDFRPEWTVL